MDGELLEYGYVLTRPPEGGWWHMHFGRCDVSYHCELLGHRTDVLACIQWFTAGAVAKSPQFLLTLDGDGVELAQNKPGLDFAWGHGARVSEALHFQRKVMPLLDGSSRFQQAAAEIVRSQVHLRVVTVEELALRQSPYCSTT